MDRARNQGTPDPARQIVELLPALNTILRRLWIMHPDRYRDHPGRRQQEEDHYQNLVLLLIEDDYRRLRSRDRGSSINAWLKVVAQNYLANSFRRRILAEVRSEVLPGSLWIEAKQEEEMLYRERVERVQEAFGQLSDQDRLLGEMLRSEAETGEIALALGIEPPQVRKRRYELIKKIRKLLAEGGVVDGEN